MSKDEFRFLVWPIAAVCGGLMVSLLFLALHHENNITARARIEAGCAEATMGHDE